VVLPFTNLSGDPSQDYFADGITENLTTDLSRIRNSFVIARNTAFTFKGKNIDSKEISKNLGVRYILEGSVQRDQNRVRVNAQLIDGETGAHLWADRFEESVTDLFKLQDQVVARLANTLGYELVKAEAQRSTHSTNPDAIDMTMRGWAAFWQPPTKESTASARDYFEHAMKIDPQSAEAMVGLAYTRYRSGAYGWSAAADDSYAAQLDLLAKATAIKPRACLRPLREKSRVVACEGISLKQSRLLRRRSLSIYAAAKRNSGSDAANNRLGISNRRSA
jgi:adenylate cyclase